MVGLNSLRGGFAGKAKLDWRDWECGKWCERKSCICFFSIAETLSKSDMLILSQCYNIS